jgi:hypothetical protein
MQTNYLHFVLAMHDQCVYVVFDEERFQQELRKKCRLTLTQTK